jgi:general secretion pathway protein G
MDPQELTAGALDLSRRARRAAREHGLTLIELLIVIALIGIIAAIAAPLFFQQLDRMKVRRAVADLVSIEFEIHRYEDKNDELPDSLEDLDPRFRFDPWGHEYVYFRFGEPGWRGRARKDRFLVPINSTFDLYSVGRDGESRPPLQNPRSFDDVIRANDGAFYGLGRDF